MQHCVSFFDATWWFDIFIYFKMITTKVMIHHFFLIHELSLLPTPWKTQLSGSQELHGPLPPPLPPRLPRSTPMFPCCFWQGSHPGTLLSSLLSGTVKFKPDSPTFLETLQWLPAKTRIEDKVFAMTVRSYLIASHHSLPKPSIGLWPLFSCPSLLHFFFLLSLHSR